MELHRRQEDSDALEPFLRIDHNRTGQISDASDPSSIFGSNTSCILTPEETIGPYWVSGTLIRSNLTNSQPGIPLHLEIELISTSNCKPLSNVLVDVWSTNATGVYSGISSDGQGGANTNFNRGVQASDSDGTVQFDMIMPGHYAGRATHIHVATHSGATLLSNGTYSGGTANHIGQLYFDEALRAAVEREAPYSGNRQQVVSNAEDGLVAEQAGEDYDPFVRYVYLGKDISDGLMAWISIGISPDADHDDQIAAGARFEGSSSVVSSGTPSTTLSAMSSAASRTSSTSSTGTSGADRLRASWLMRALNMYQEL